MEGLQWLWSRGELGGTGWGVGYVDWSEFDVAWGGKVDCSMEAEMPPAETGRNRLISGWGIGNHFCH